MNQGGHVPALASQNPNPVEANQVTGGAHGYASYYTSVPVYDAAAWGTQGTDGLTSGAVITQNYKYAQPTETLPKAVNVASQDSLGSGTNASEEKTNCLPYQSSADPYNYSNAAPQSYFNNYQQQSTHASSQPAGPYQNLGAPYQPISSFQNTGSYAEPATYSSTYYNPGGYQTSSGGYQNQTTAGGYQNQTTAGGYPNQTTAGGYQNQTTVGGYPMSSYHNQINVWNGGGHPNYNSQQQTYYAPDSNIAYSSASTNSTAAQYQQPYSQWTDYYNQTEVSCAPGTEHISRAGPLNPGYAVPGVSSAYSTTVTLQPRPVTPSSRLEPTMNELTASQTINIGLQCQQTSDVGSGVQDTYWQHTMPGFQNQHVRPHVDYQNRTDTNQSYNSFQESLKTTNAHGTNSQYMFVQKVPPSYQPPQQTVPSADPRGVSNIRIPTNPRIASNLPFTSPKINKGHSTTAVTARPAYISVSAPKSNEKTAESTPKTGIFPKSLRGYVERALARCKDDEQKAASQAVMTEIITKATADGTLHTRDWDTEPLFALPASFKFQTLTAVPSATLKRSTTRRSKSRWEPVQEDKPAEKFAPVDNGMFNFGGWVPSSDSNNKFQSVNLENKEEKSSNSKFKYEQKSARKNGQIQFKRQRLNEGVVANNGDASSDSDKEQSLTAFYSGAITLANTPEEKERRESRSKRFEGLRHQPECNHPRSRPTAETHLYTKRARELALSKTCEETTSTAVEDIDWDALTVKGTSQEIEKRYLRLTCAPDPASVRPEEILEIALTMVQNSKKNYLYKCDQLKSIRQDLTIQRIRNWLTVLVYETHARLALEVGDLPEYNQCQSQLQSLYADGIEGSYMEFSAYNLLCVMLHSKNTRDLVSAMSRLSIESKRDEAVKHALAVRTAVTSGNYVLFFKLYKSAPKLHACLMDIYVEKMRFWAIKCMSRSCRPTVPVSYISQVLGFGSVISTPEGDNNDSGGIEECIEWLKAHGAVLTAATNGDTQLDAKCSSSSLFMPEPEDAVPHGDANLAVDDFFTRAS